MPPPWVSDTPTSEVNRKLVRSLAERHLPPTDIVTLLEQFDGTRIDEDALSRAFDFEIRMGRAQGRLAIADALNKAMRDGNPAAMIYLSKVHLGWREKGPDRKAKTTSTLWPSNRQMARILNIRDPSSQKS